MSTTIRKPNDWQVGDRVYVHDPDDHWSKGDIFTVRHIVYGHLYKGEENNRAQNGIAKSRCYRILTVDEVRALKPGDRVIDLRYESPTTGFGDCAIQIGPNSTTYRNPPRSLYERYALVSLAPREPSELQRALDDLAVAHDALERAERRIAEMNT